MQVESNAALNGLLVSHYFLFASSILSPSKCYLVNFMFNDLTPVLSKHFSHNISFMSQEFTFVLFLKLFLSRDLCSQGTQTASCHG